MQNKRLLIPPVAASTTTTTVLVDPTVTTLTGGTGFTMTQPYILIRHIRATNTSATQYTVTMFYGSASTNAFAWSATPVAGNSYLDWYGEIRLDGNSTKLYGGASNAAIYFNFDDAEIGVS